MKKFNTLGCLSLGLFFMVACGDGKQEPTSSLITNDTTTKETTTVENPTEEAKTAIALWDASIKAEGKNSAKWVASYHFGEVLTLLGEEQIDGKRTMIKVKTSEGKEGWTSDYLIAKNAKLAVATQDIVIYTKPSAIGVSKDVVKVAEFVVVYDDEMNGYHEFHTKEKKVKGWIKRGYSVSDLDIEVASLYKQIINEKSDDKKNEILSMVSDNKEYVKSPFYNLIFDIFAPETEEDDVLDSALVDEVITEPGVENMTNVLENAVDSTETMEDI
ncbi:MAG: hypothetical protein GY827_10040 [Cytophagales bacterium]|nr:hypothetical protein [Cytophagales bacterium]